MSVSRSADINYWAELGGVVGAVTIALWTKDQ